MGSRIGAGAPLPLPWRSGLPLLLISVSRLCVLDGNNKWDTHGRNLKCFHPCQPAPALLPAGPEQPQQILEDINREASKLIISKRFLSGLHNYGLHKRVHSEAAGSEAVSMWGMQRMCRLQVA